MNQRGTAKEGLYYYSGSMFRGPTLAIWPDGTAYYVGPIGAPQKKWLSAPDLWQRVTEIMAGHGTEPVTVEFDPTTGVCDGRETELAARVGEIQLGFKESASCEGFRHESNQAGEELVELVEDYLARQKAARRIAF